MANDMATKTWRERVAAYLVAHGYTIVENNLRSQRYVTYGKPDTQTTYFLGKAGAVLVSRNRHITQAVSLTEATHKAVMVWEKKNI